MTKTGKERLAVVETKVDDLKDDNIEIKAAIHRIDCKLDEAIRMKTDQSEFLYWRNILVSGILISIGLMLLSISIK